MIENQIGKKVKHLRFDKSLEFCSNEFNALWKSEGILRHLMVPGAPQQNNVAEQMNKTLMEKI